MTACQSSIPDYPQHTHQFVAAFYEDGRIDYIFGPFSTAFEAHSWARKFNKSYAKPGERRRYNRFTIYPICEALPPEAHA